jgi:hypothetical protein
MRQTLRRPGIVVLVCFALLQAAARPAGAAELKPITLAAYNQYVAARDAQFDEEVTHDPFLWCDAQPEQRRKALFAQLQRKDVVIEHMELLQSGKKFSVPGGMVHHWLGIVFIPGAKVDSVLRVVEDYDHHSTYFAPEVVRSKLLSHEDGHFVSLLRFHKKHILSVTVDSVHDAVYRTLGPTRAVSRSRTTRVQEVENAGEKDERLLPEGDDHGFFWRMNTYWKFEEKDGGTYVQCESVTLTRNIPLLLKPIIEPFVTSVPRESLVGVLTHTRSAVERARGGQEPGDK